MRIVAVGARPSPRTGAIALRRPRGLDPRTQLLLVVAASIALFSPLGARLLPAGIAIGVGLACFEGAWRRALGLVTTTLVLVALGWIAPAAWPNALTALIAITSALGLRFVVVASIGAHLVATTSPTRLAAALRAWRAPRSLAVTLAVMLRFLPVVRAEAAAVLDAMRLRGLAGARGVLRRPLLAVERFTVPMIAASLRASEDLSASAILRGLGARSIPTAMHPPRLGGADLALVLAAAALTTLALLLPPVLA